MSSNSETGHAKNVANFLDLITFCKGYKGQYNPSKAAIQLPQLSVLYTAAEAGINEVTKLNTAFSNAVNARADIFKNNKQLSTRVINAFDTTEASDKAKKDIKVFNRKIQGKRASTGTPVSQPVGTDVTLPKINSVSQQSFDQQIEHFKGIVSALESEPSYTPNETDLKIDSLNALIKQQAQANSDVAAAFTTVDNARIARDAALYDEKKGLYNISLDVKKYIKSVFGATSPQFKQVSGIKFIKRKA